MRRRAKTLFVLILAALIVFSYSNVHAQDVRDTTTNGENDDEDSTLKATALKNFTGVALRDVIYTTQKNVQDVQQPLGIDIYKPPQADGKKFPLVLLIHGGGFKRGTKKPLGIVCAALAERGYVAATIDYRLGWGGTRKVCSADTVQLKQAIYRALQDAHSALRYLTEHADEYSIDKDSVFIGGGSAGAVTALFTAYLSQQEADQYFTGLSKSMGPLDDSTRNENSAYKLRGIISMWGAFADPQLITSANALPTIFFHGEKDQTVPFKFGPIIPCPDASVIYGTYPLYNRLKDLGITAIAHVDPEGGHGVFSLDFRVANILCFLSDVRAGNKKDIYLEGEQSSCN